MALLAKKSLMSDLEYIDFLNGLNPFERLLEAERLFRGLQPVGTDHLTTMLEVLGGESVVEEKFALTQGFFSNIQSRHPKSSLVFASSQKLLGAAIYDACKFWVMIPGQLLFEFDNFQHLEMAEILLKAMNRINRAYLHQVQTRRLEDLRVLIRRSAEQQNFRTQGDRIPELCALSRNHDALRKPGGRRVSVDSNPSVSSSVGCCYVPNNRSPL
jgi:hypothetical protein